jgi:hypothetical protein
MESILNMLRSPLLRCYYLTTMVSHNHTPPSKVITRSICTIVVIYNFHPHDGESIAQAWGRLKSLTFKCPIHELPHNIVINNFYARLSGHYKDYLDACF